MSHVFLSYRREDKERVERLYQELVSRGIDVWRDTDRLVPGERWRDRIRNAIEKGAFFVACFSRAYGREEPAYAREELTIAIEQMRQRPRDRVWFIPVALDADSVPRDPIGPNETLHDLQRVDLSADWSAGVRALYDVLSKSALLRSPYPDPITKAPDYQVGAVTAAVFPSLLGGGDEAFLWDAVAFYYKHEKVPLPEAIESQRGVLVAREQARRCRKVFFDGPTVRLHSIDLGVCQDPSGAERKRPILHLRPSTWFDYVLTNQRLDEPIPELGATLRQKYADEVRLITSRTIDWVPFSNILTCTVVLLSSDGHVRLTKRSDLVDNAAGLLAASVAENVHRWKDEIDDPANLWHHQFRNEAPVRVDASYRPTGVICPFLTALRGVAEEVGPEVATSIKPDDLKLIAVGWDLAEFNPHLYLIARSSLALRNIERLERGSRATDGWEGTGFWVPFEPAGPLKLHLVSSAWAAISKGALMKALVHEFGFEKVESALMS